MTNDAFTRKTHRLQREPLNWKPVAATPKHHGEQAASHAFASLPTWPGYRDARTTTHPDSQAACEALSASDDTDPSRRIS
jgi:hypothetical protein